MTSATIPIAKWYTGKALQTILTYVIPTLERAMADGYWQPGDSRKVRAALNKQAVAAKFAKVNDCYPGSGRGNDSPDLLSNIGPEDARHNDTGWALNHAMMFGQAGNAANLLDLVDRLVPYATTPAAREALAVATGWVRDFAPIAKLLERLDATRPKPVVVMGSISPTVLANVGQAMGIDFSTIESPPVEWTWVQMEIKGKTVRVPVGEILWPEGTRHFTSRYSSGHQCEACGHGIKTNNWVPLLARTATGPVSLWVGRDCARNLFAVDVKGEATYTTGPSAAAA